MEVHQSEPMSNPLIVKFQFSASDLADVALRTVDDSSVVSKWRIQAKLVGVVIFGLIFYGYVPGTPGKRILYAIVACSVTLILLHVLPEGSSRKDRLLQYYREKLGGDGPYECEVELTAESLITRQFGVEGKHAWSHVLSAIEVQDGIEFKYKPVGALLVRNRAFGTLEARRTFFQFALQQIGVATK